MPKPRFISDGTCRSQTLHPKTKFKTKLPTHIDVPREDAGLAKDSIILLEQIRTIDKRRLKEKIGHLDDELMTRVNEALEISFGLI